MSDDVRLGGESTEPEVDDYRPSEWESAFLSIALFGGLIIFGVGCLLFRWG
jgi:hypothetical protein